MNRVNDSMQKRIEAMADKVSKARHDWMDGLMKKVLPPKLYNLAHQGDATGRKKMARYLQKHGYRLRDFPESHTTELLHGMELLGDFTVQVVNNRLEILGRDLTKANP